jgi:hypothetical protein
MTDQNQDMTNSPQDLNQIESNQNNKSNGHETKFSDAVVDKAQPQPSLGKDDNAVWQAYLKSKKKYYEVYRYLAEN